MKVVLCRHGKPENADTGKRYLGVTDEPLSDEGMAQAEALGAKIKSSPEMTAATGVRIVSSDLIRAFETALVIKNHLGCEFIETDRRLREIDMGEWDGRYFEEIRRAYPEEYEARGRDLWSYRVPGGESFCDAGKRLRTVISELTASASPDEIIVIVSHQGAMRAGLSFLTDAPFGELMKQRIPYAGALILDMSDGKAAVEGCLWQESI